MFTSKWTRKGDGYELLDGAMLRASSVSSSSSGGSSGSTPPPQYQCDASSVRQRQSSLTSQTLHIARRNRRKVFVYLTILVSLIVIQAILRVVFMPPAYVVLEPESYLETLEGTLREKIPLQSTTSRAAILANLRALYSKETLVTTSNGTEPESLVPNTIFSSDQHAAPSDWAPMWKKMGFQAKFYNDEEADAWVESVWKGTQVVTAWRDMPRAILSVMMMKEAVEKRFVC